MSRADLTTFETCQRAAMTPMTHRVFVYGTLKRGYSNHPMLATAKEFFGDVATINTYRMLTIIHPSGMFPVILDDPNGKPVCGEIYHVEDETLARLDQLEREGSSYDRKLIDVTLPLARGSACRPRRLYTLDAKIALAKHSLVAHFMSP